MSDEQYWDANGLSDLIGAIYDCAVDPDGWIDVLCQITTLLEPSTSAVSAS